MLVPVFKHWIRQLLLIQPLLAPTLNIDQIQQVVTMTPGG